MPRRRGRSQLSGKGRRSRPPLMLPARPKRFGCLKLKKREPWPPMLRPVMARREGEGWVR